MRIALTNITERKQMETMLRESEEKFRAIFKGTLDGIVLADPETKRFNTCNPAFCRMLGYSSKEITKLGVADIHPLQDLPHVIEQFESQLRGETQLSTAIPVKRKDGSVFYVDIKSARMHLGGKLYLIGIFRDITERYKLVNELRESHQLLRELADKVEKLREEERKRIAREVHDELGQILTALRMDIALISLRFGDQNAELLEKTEGMTALLDQAGWCVRDIVSNLRPTALDMGIVAAVKWLCSEYAAHTGSACVLHTDEESIELDENRAVGVFRIVQELLTNAARHAEATHVQITLARHDEDLHIQVRDNGIGFDPAVAASKKTYGLLGISERAIALDGDVDIVSAQDQGTSVFVRVPVKRKRSRK